MSAAATLECKKLLVQRCIRAVMLSAATQFLLLTVFLLCVNFDILHPINWIFNTIGLVCSFYTWFSIIPLISAVLVYGTIMAKLYLAERRYYATRYLWLLHNVPRKLLFLGAHILIGFFTAYLYTSFLHVDYRHLTYECYGQQCVSSYHTFLVGIGIFAGCYHFVRIHMRQEVVVEFPIVQQTQLVKLRMLLYSTLFKSVVKSVLPTLCFACLYLILGGFLNRLLAGVFKSGRDDRLGGFFGLVSNIRLLFYGWILTSQILSNMNLMQRFYSLLLSEELPLIIARSRLPFADNNEITLVEALGVSKIYVVQCLAAQFFYQISLQDTSPHRNEIFQLSEPGNHPLNWTQLCNQCLSVLRAFTDDLTASMKQISAMKDAQVYMPSITPSAQFAAEKFLLRQYNEMHGIRSIGSPIKSPAPTQSMMCEDNRASKLYLGAGGIHHVPNICERMNARCEQFSRQLDRGYRNFISCIPGIVFFFSEPDGAKTLHLLDNLWPIILLSQGLAGICAASIKEDRYGVVQNNLPEILRVLLKLKTELDKLNNITINGKKLDRNFFALKATLRRSLTLIAISFGDSIRELLPDPLELRQLQSVLSCQE